MLPFAIPAVGAIVKGLGIISTGVGILQNLGVFSKYGKAVKAAACVSTGSIVKSFALNAVSGIAVQMGVTLALKAASYAIPKVARFLGITKKEEKPAEIGYRIAEQESHPDWKSRDDFTSFEKFNDYLKQKVPDIDGKKLLDNIVPYTALGTTSLFKEIGVHQKVELPDEFLALIGTTGMEPEEIDAIITAAKKEKVTGEKLNDFFQGTLPFEKDEAMTAAILENLKKSYPGKTEAELLERLEDMKSAAQDDRAVKRIWQAEVDQKTQKCDAGTIDAYTAKELASTDGKDTPDTL